MNVVVNYFLKYILEVHGPLFHTKTATYKNYKI